MPYSVRLTLFIVVAVIIGFLFLAIFLLPPLRRALYRRHPMRMFYRHVMRTARDGDYYLINDFTLRTGKEEFIHVDHLLAGDKYLYVVTDRYYEGAVNAKPDDFRWLLYERGGGKRYVSNPLVENKTAMERLSILSGIPTSYMVGVVLVNDDCFVNRYDSEDGENFLVSERKFARLVRDFEGRGVEPFRKEELWQTVQDLHELKEGDR